MKRCPQCNRIETDEVLKFCRADGTTLISESDTVGPDVGTAKFGSGAVSNEIETSILPHRTDADMNRPTAQTTVLPAAQTPGSTRALNKPKRRGLLIALATVIALGIAVAGYFYFARNPSFGNRIDRGSTFRKPQWQFGYRLSFGRARRFADISSLATSQPESQSDEFGDALQG